MRILVVADRLRRDGANGAEIFCGELCHRLARRHQLTLLLRGEPQPEPPPAAPSLVLGDGAAAGAAELAAALGGRLRWGDFDLLYNLGGLLFGSRVVHLLRLLGCDLPLVNHFQALLGEYARREGLGAAEQSAHAAVQRTVSAQAVLNVFPSQAECARAAELGFGGPACGVAVIPNGIAGADMAEVANAADVADVAGMRSVADVGNVADVVCVGNGAAVAGPPASPASPASPADDCGGDAGRRMVFVTAGRFSDRVKGADLVYRAFVRLYQERQDVFLLSVGNRPRFAEILGALPEVSHRVIEWLPRARFMAVLAAADAVVLPSRYEPFGMIAVEAMRLGLPVVAPAVGGLREIVAHGETGLLTHLEDGSFGLYRAMARLAADPAAARAMGQAGRRRAADLYDIERVAASVDRALRLAVWEGAVRPLRTLLAGDPAAASW